SLDVKRFMSIVILALLPVTLFGILNAGYQAAVASGRSLSWAQIFIEGLWIFGPMILVTYAVGFFWEILFASIRNHAISEGLLVSGLLFPLILPPTLPLWQVAVGFSFGIVIGKEIFGGVGRNFLNPALTGRAFIFFAYPTTMSGDSVWTAGTLAADAVSGATPLAAISLAEAGQKAEGVLTAAGYTLFDLIIGSYPGSIGGTSTLLCLVGAVILIATGIASYKIMVGGVLGVMATGYILNLFAGVSGNAWLTLNPLYHLVMGGFAFGIVFMATDPVSSPGMETSRWVFGFLVGALTVLIRVFNPAYPEGVMLAILFMNVFAPLLDYFEIKLKVKKRIPNV
ncbi:MAG: NADH:ubiquinone reductase (Na(+)-transporting) subunit B, partial [Desulfobacterales bacterium]|nr:NADH:ubiquinone reductase (Na(+)-transporting) subunit B [Desulfobacterales bacterium]